MKMRWTDEETLKLIDLYHSCEHLWNKKSPLNKNLPARKQAYDEIVQEMGIPSLTVKDVRVKVKNLRSSYYSELRRMEKVGYVSTRKMQWFFALKPMMTEIAADKETYGSEASDFSDESGEDTLFEESSSNGNSYVVSIKQEYLDELEHTDKTIDPEDCLEPVPKRMKQNVIEDTDVDHSAGAVSIVKKNKGDEFQMFSNNLAAQLRKMPLDSALIIQVEVQSLIAKERIRLFKKQNEETREEDSS